MKILISIFFSLLVNQVICQNGAFFANSDSCKIFYKEFIKDSTFTIKVVNHCENLSAIQQAYKVKGWYSKNGPYTEFYDTSFKLVKKTGFFWNGIENGVWKEFYANGKLKDEGACEVLKLVQSISDPYVLLYINMQNTKDTIKLKFNFSVFDSLKRLTQFHYFPSYEISGFITPVYYSLKDGVWIYYSEDGKLLRKEFYDHGTLKKFE